MQVKKIICPNCGGTLDVGEGQKRGAVKCLYCGSSVYLDEKEPDIYQTINIKEVNIGTQKEKPGSSHPIIMAVAIMLSMAFVFGIAAVMSRTGDTTTEKYVYRSSPEDKAVQGFVEAFFEKPLSDITASDYESVRYLSIKRDGEGDYGDVSADTPWVFTASSQTDDEGRPISPVEIRIPGTEKIEKEDMQVFSSLQVLNLNEERDIQWKDIYKGGNLKNLSQISYYGRSGSEFTEETAQSLKDPSQIRGLLAVPYINSKEELEALCLFSGLYSLELSGIEKNIASDFSFLSSFRELRELYLSPHAGTWDISGLSALTKLKILKIYGYDVNFENISVFNGMPQLEDISLDNVGALKNLDFVKNMPSLKRLTIEYCPIIDLNGLSDSASLTALSLHYCGELRDISALAGIKNLKDLDIAHIWNFDLEFPDLTGLTLLEKLTIESSHLETVTGMPSIRELTVFETGGSYSMAPLLGMQSLEKLTLNNYIDAEKPDMAETLSTLSSLRELIIEEDSLHDGMDYAGIFSLPNITSLTILSENSDYGYISLNPENLLDNSTLERLDIKNLRIWNTAKPDDATLPLGKCAEGFFTHFPSLHYLNISGTGLEQLDFLAGMKELEELDISDNYVRDLRVLRELPNLTILHCEENPIENLDIIPEGMELKR